MNIKNRFLQKNFKKGLENFKKNNFSESENFFKKIIKILPNEIDSIFYLGIISFKKNEYKRSIYYLKKVIEKNYNHKQSNLFIGLSYYKIRDYNKAKFFFEKIYKTNEKDFQIIINLSLTLIELKEYANAENILKNAINLNPKHLDTLNCLGNLYLNKGNTDEAIKYYLKFVEINQNNPIVYSNLGTAYLRKTDFISSKDNSDFISSKDNFEKALKISPNNSIALNAFSYLLLSNCEIEKGLDAYENRKFAKKNEYEFKTIGNEWEGENLDNKTILILSEQGIGDIIQFSRYIYFIKEKYSVNIIFKLDKNLINLFNQDKFKIISKEDEIPEYDYFQYLMSLPRIIYKTDKKFVKNINFIRTNTKKKIFWTQKLSYLKGAKIGLNWQGNPNNPIDYKRSIPLSYFEKFFEIDNLNFISLQKGAGINQIKDFKYKNKLLNFSNKTFETFEDTIAIIENLDLVITTDTSIVHLASTMEKDTWLILGFSPGWRWDIHSKMFKWYKNLKIYNQKKINNWDPVINSINQNLRNLFIK